MVVPALRTQRQSQKGTTLPYHASASTRTLPKPGEASPDTTDSALSLIPSALRPPVPASERIFAWRGVHSPPQTTIAHPLLRQLALDASQASLRDSTNASYGAGLRKFHIFCDIFSIPEEARLPTQFTVLHSFILWATADVDPSGDPNTTRVASAGSEVPLEPISVQTASKYLSAVRAWHIAQGWPAPLSDPERAQIDWSLRGIARLQAQRRKRPPRPPITIPMLISLKGSLDLRNPFEACIWAAATCAFWGLMRFGEATVRTRTSFSPSKHLTRSHALFSRDLRGSEYLRLDLPEAKTAGPGEVQHVFLVPQKLLCPLEAVRNLAAIVPAGPHDPFFSWRDEQGNIRPLTRDAALRFLNRRLAHLGFGTTFGHSFRIGGASFLLAQGVSPEIVRLMGRWRSLAYEVYIRAFEQVVSHHTANIAFAWPEA